MGSLVGFATVCIFSSMFLFMVAASEASSLPKFFNVVSYGAVADGKTDNSQAFQKAWTNACEYKGIGRVFIPRGTYMLRSMIFEGPCAGPLVFEIEGTLRAPTDEVYGDSWIGFRYVDKLAVKGGGYLDGRGDSAWAYNDCEKNPHCRPLPVSLRFDFVTNSRIHHLRSINSKSTHINLFACQNVNISHVRISAPTDSPNTDGIHIGSSTGIKIYRSVIGTGDDCISMVSGSKNIEITGVTCGPGHGISIGSLGKSHDDEYVMGVNIRNCTFQNTQNGLRIKTWAPSSASVVSGVRYENIVMHNVNNPIIIDQHYCPVPPCDDEAHSSVAISNVTFRNIWGTSSSQTAVSLECSNTVPCRNVQLININLRYTGTTGTAKALCSNVKGSSSGRQFPPGCL